MKVAWVTALLQNSPKHNTQKASGYSGTQSSKLKSNVKEDKKIPGSFQCVNLHTPDAQGLMAHTACSTTAISK